MCLVPIKLTMSLWEKQRVWFIILLMKDKLFIVKWGFTFNFYPLLQCLNSHQNVWLTVTQQSQKTSANEFASCELWIWGRKVVKKERKKQQTWVLWFKDVPFKRVINKRCLEHIEKQRMWVGTWLHFYARFHVMSSTETVTWQDPRVPLPEAEMTRKGGGTASPLSSPLQPSPIWEAPLGSPSCPACTAVAGNILRN